MLHIFYFSRRYKMEFPREIQAIINQYAKPASATLRADWRQGSSIINILKEDLWWKEYVDDRPVVFDENMNDTWYEWCLDKIIIGPPRYRSPSELTGYNDWYMDDHEIQRHYIPWTKTWPAHDDLSWCIGPHHTTLPDWVIAEYNAETNPALC